MLKENIFKFYVVITVTITLAISIINFNNENSSIYINDGSLPLGQLDLNEVVSLVDDRGYVNVARFGVVGDGKTDDSDNLLSAIEYCKVNNYAIYIPSDYICNVTKDIDFFGIKHIVSEGRIVALNKKITIYFGYNSNHAIATSYFFNEVENLNLSFTGGSNANVRINTANLVTLHADGDRPEKSFIAYSTINLGRIDELVLSSSGTDIGWINENRFYGGRIKKLVIDGNYPHNNNVFYGTMFEDFSAKIISGNNNYFKDCRFEGEISLYFGKDTYNNFFERTWFELEPQYLMGTYTHGLNITNNGLSNGVVAAPDKYFYKTEIYDIALDKIDDVAIQKIANDYIVRKDYYKIYESDLFRVTHPIGIRLTTHENIFALFVYAYDLNGKLLTNDVAGAVKSNGIRFDTNNHHYWFDGANIGSSPVTNIALYPNENIGFYKIVLETGHRVTGKTFSELSMTLVEPFETDTNINRKIQ